VSGDLLAALLQQVALLEERCMETGPCRSPECAVCVFNDDTEATR
jgi:hypothetical protein